jgi:hypothetical protein
MELEKKNLALEEHAFIHAHKLSSPVASISGLFNLMKKEEVADEGKSVLEPLNTALTVLKTW